MDKVEVVLLGLLISIVFLYENAHADTYRSSDGASCSYNRDHSDMEVKLYVVGKSNENKSTYQSTGKENTVGVEFVYKIGAPKKMDCSRLYELDLQYREAEYKRLKLQVELMEKASNIKWDGD